MQIIKTISYVVQDDLSRKTYWYNQYVVISYHVYWYVVKGVVSLKPSCDRVQVWWLVVPKWKTRKVNKKMSGYNWCIQRKMSQEVKSCMEEVKNWRINWCRTSHKGVNFGGDKIDRKIGELKNGEPILDPSM